MQCKVKGECWYRTLKNKCSAGKCIKEDGDGNVKTISQGSAQNQDQEDHS